MLTNVTSAPTYDLASLQAAQRSRTAAPPSGAAADRVSSGIDGEVRGQPAKDDAPAVQPRSIEDLLESLPDDVRDNVRKYVTGEVAGDHYSPENTADRIVDFALSGFARFEGGAAAEAGTPDARRRFVDFILPAIERGYQDALELLGDLAEPVAASLQETRDIVGRRLETFAASDPIDVEA